MTSLLLILIAINFAISLVTLGMVMQVRRRLDADRRALGNIGPMLSDQMRRFPLRGF